MKEQSPQKNPSWVEWLWRVRGWKREEIYHLLEIPPSKKTKSPWCHAQLPVSKRKDLERLPRDLLTSKPPFTYLTLVDEAFPAKLRNLHDPPCVLYLKGNNEILKKSGPWISVVGTRRVSSYGLSICEALVREMEPFDPVIVSGMAEGVDGRAHRAALDAGLATVGVLGTSLDRVYPQIHGKLWNRMIQEGLLISEVFPGAPMGPWRFPERNRVIAGLSDALIVVEAPIKSGALLTANFALDLGKEIFVIPGPISSPHNRGGHALIQQGAHLLTRASEVFEILGVVPKKSSRMKKIVSRPWKTLSKSERGLMEFLSREPASIDKLIHIGHLPAAQLRSLLIEWCLKGWVEETSGGLFKIVY